MAYAEIHPDERVGTCAPFLHRAVSWFRERHYLTVRRVLTHDAKAHRVGTDRICVWHGTQLHRRFAKPRCPWTNGKTGGTRPDRLTEWTYARPTKHHRARRRL